MRYTVHQLSAAQNIPIAIATRYGALRRRALQQYPGLYGSIHDETVFTASDWLALLQEPGRHTLVCIASSKEEEHASLADMDAEWVSGLTLTGPLTLKTILPSASVLQEDTKMQLPDVTYVQWLWSGMYLEASHRSGEIMIVLREAFLDFLRTYAEDHLPISVDEQTGKERERFAVVRGCLRPHDTILKSLYEQFGGKQVGALELESYYNHFRAKTQLVAESECEGIERITLMEGIIEC